MPLSLVPRPALALDVNLWKMDAQIQEDVDADKTGEPGGL